MKTILFILLLFAGHAAFAQTPLITREGRGAACQVDFTVVNTSGSSLSHRYEWLLAPEQHYFYISNSSYFQVRLNCSTTPNMYTVYKSNIDATPGAYVVVYPSGGSSPRLFIKNSNATNPGMNQYSFYFQW